MNIISETDLSRVGSDCLIKQSLLLCEQYEMYFVLRITKISGWADHKEVSVVDDITTSKEKAIQTYKNNGGVYKPAA